ncbi:hypothetical protein XENOCAPTIV_028930 [Xenoophorus captivus]|uniref:Uncharacterized protein n=1 Tax=Xenoophorus captivus TaxID=1517983 RepID=A0ABV0QCG0_9TELE
MGESQVNHPAATVQKPQGAGATSPHAPLAAIYARADPAMDPETRDLKTHDPLSSGPTEPMSPGPGKQPPGVSRHTPKHPAPDTKEPQVHQRPEKTSHRQRVWQGGPPGPNKPTNQHPSPSPPKRTPT